MEPRKRKRPRKTPEWYLERLEHERQLRERIAHHERLARIEDEQARQSGDR